MMVEVAAAIVVSSHNSSNSDSSSNSSRAGCSLQRQLHVLVCSTVVHHRGNSTTTKDNSFAGHDAFQSNQLLPRQDNELPQ
jgi:hypothetical protein